MPGPVLLERDKLLATAPDESLGRAANIAAVIWTEAFGLQILASIISILFKHPLGWPVPPLWSGILALVFFRIVPGVTLPLWLISWFIDRRARQRPQPPQYEQVWR